MILAGVDLAWQSDKNPSAVAFGILNNTTLTLQSFEPEVTGIYSVFKLLVNKMGLTGIAIDAPLIIDNISGQRFCEKGVGKVYGRRGVSCHTSNKNLYPEAYSVILSKELKLHGFNHLHGNKWQIECYPHPAIIEIFDLDRRLKYKKGKVQEKQIGQIRLGHYLKSLSTSNVLRLLIGLNERYLLEESYINNLSGKSLKSNENALDSILCLYIAGLYAIGSSGQTFGVGNDGYIWVPKVNCLPKAEKCR